MVHRIAQIDPPLSQGVGYGLVVGLGAAFAILMSLISKALERYMNERQDSEFHMTAKHSVSAGLVASAVVSSWTLAATLLTSCTYAYQYGVSGAYWYGAGAAVQIMIFSWVAIEFKRKAPHAHTFLEVARVRFGAPGHLVLMAYAVFYQILTSVNLLVGASSVYTAMTGVNPYACCVLFPLGVVVYTLFGGIKATFLTDYVHTFIILIIILISLFTVYTTSDLIGSPDRMHDLLSAAAARAPVPGNADGQYLTMRSTGGIEAGMVIFVIGWAAIVDLQLFQKAVAADPKGTLKGYVLGGLAWFAIPFCLATTFGIAAVALEGSTSFPTYPNRMTESEVAFGLALPYTAQAILGSGGSAAVMLMLFMAVTSTMSSEVVCACSIATYDLYRPYFRPHAHDASLLRISHLTLCLFSLVVAAVASAFLSADVGVTYILTAAGIVVAPAIFPILATVLWRDLNTLAVCVAPLLGTVAGVVCWIVAAWRLESGHKVTRETTGEVRPLLVGNHVAMWSSLVFLVGVSLCRPQRFEWEKLKQIKLVAADGGGDDADAGLHMHKEAENDGILKRSRWWAIGASIVLFLTFFVFWPLPMYGSSYVFSKRFFRGWVAFTFLWAFFSAVVVGVLPAYEGFPSCVRFVRSVYAGFSGGSPDGDDDDIVVEGRRVETAVETKTVGAGGKEKEKEEEKVL